jgi:predicted metal-dependent peptidase
MNTLNEVSSITKKLMLLEPFYGIFASSLNKVVRKDVPTAGVSKQNINYQLAINEEFWASLGSDNKKIGLIKHELLHICFHHLVERENYPNHRLHNIAADLEINQFIEPQYYPSPDLILLSSFPTLKLPVKAGTKEYYRLLQKAKQQNTSPELNDMLDGMGSDFHGTWKEFDELSDAEKQLVKAQVGHQIKNIVDELKKNNGMDSIPNELKSYIDSLYEIKPPSYDWKGYLRRFSSTSTKTYTKKTRRKLNKRYEENPALKIKTKKHILVGVDTSGSVGENDLEEFFNEIYHIHKTGVQVSIAEGDAAIHNVYEYKGKIPKFVSGRGGTDMNPFIEYVNKHKEYSNLIVLTDGFIPERSINTFKPLLTVICSNGEEVTKVKELGWINTIKITR